jgi:hypothetical protein
MRARENEMWVRVVGMGVVGGARFLSHATSFLLQGDRLIDNTGLQQDTAEPL